MSARPKAGVSLPKAKVVADYDRAAPYINFGYRLFFPHRERFMRTRVLPRLGIQPGHRVLDLCCGAGHNLPLLAEAVGPGGEVVGIDFSEGMLERARERIRDGRLAQVSVLAGDAYELPAVVGGRAPFDRVLCSLGIGLMTDPVAFLRAAEAVMKPGARIALIDHTPYGGLMRLLNPLVYLAMLPIPSNNVAIFRLARPALAAIPAVFPDVEVEEHYARSLFVAVATRSP